MLLNFKGLALVSVRGIRIRIRQRGKFGLPDAHNADREMRGQINATDERGGADDEVRNENNQTQLDSLDRHSKDGDPHESDEAGESQGRRADQCRHGSRDSYTHDKIRADLFFMGNNREEWKWAFKETLVKARPVVGDKNGITGIGRVVLYAGGLARSDALKA